jgi:phosphatidylserine/phosphatidylglycerophosphate/cardiolipin synthase-like enzyme
MDRREALRAAGLTVGSTLAGGLLTHLASPSLDIHFSPPGCADALAAVAAKAGHSILVQAYGFTNARIAAALVDAARRGCRVECLFDASDRDNRLVLDMARQGVNCWIDAKHAIAHNKVMIFDNLVVATGSFNFTEAAERRNAENLIVIHNPAAAARYRDNWKLHRSHSDPFVFDGGKT